MSKVHKKLLTRLSTVALAVSLSACGGGGGGSSSDDDKKQPPPAQNNAPVISGAPQLSVSELQSYSTQVSATDADSTDTLTFSATNLPAWLSLNTATGEISGTPGLDDAGTYENIVITVSDGTDSDALEAFTIMVDDTYVVSGPVVDGYVSGAVVYLDSNLNGEQDETEPFAISDASGIYELHIHGDDRAMLSMAPLRAYLGAEADDISRDNDDFAAMPVTLSTIPFTALNYDKAITHVISPYTSILTTQLQSELNQLHSGSISFQTFRDAVAVEKNELSNIYGINSAGMFGDFLSATAPISADEKTRLAARAEQLVTQWQYELSDSHDLDNDGIVNSLDNDIDGDGVNNELDAFPTDPTEWSDMDMDFIGDNADNDRDGDGIENNEDAFPDDVNEWIDSDSDGYGDNSDAFPSDSDEWLDSDSDGYGDNSDAFPSDPSEWLDTDGDGTGDNSDDDIDGDGLLNDVDPNESVYDKKISELTFTDSAIESCLANSQNDYAYKVNSFTCENATITNLQDITLLSNLQYLNLPGSDVTDWAAISQLSGLLQIEVSGSNFTDTNLLAALSKLQKLVINDTSVTDINPLLSIPSLLAVEVHGTELTDAQYISLIDTGIAIHSLPIEVEQTAGFYAYSDYYIELMSNLKGKFYKQSGNVQFNWKSVGDGVIEISDYLGKSNLIVVSGTAEEGVAIKYKKTEQGVEFSKHPISVYHRAKLDYTYAPLPNVMPSNYDICVGIEDTNQIGCSKYEIAGELEILTFDVNGDDVELPMDAVVQAGGIIAQVSYGNCALYNNSVHCDGGEFEANPEVTNPEILAVGLTHYCVAQADQQVKCFGDEGMTVADTVPTFSDVTQLVSGDQFSCAVDAGAVKCWGDDLYDVLDVPQLGTVTQLYSNNTLVCAVDENATTCWGQEEQKLHEVPSLQAATESLIVHNDSVCSLGNGSVDCWGQDAVEEWNEELQQVVIIEWIDRVNVPVFNDTVIDLIDGIGREYCALLSAGALSCFEDMVGDAYAPTTPLMENIEWAVSGPNAICVGNNSGLECILKEPGGSGTYQDEVYVLEPFTFN
ncbi:putative Ig domain-containing protein [Thalassotalea sp. Y01]|uniref:putative Ig domain-containing protein n=1 Tax=Thalassotalea sp. Y01 TaxID=2729613 RepID=UPI00145F4FCD|nr:putative Ig domain-containing protein [Thalassotalea sp. Y01]NMP14811.1 hypothetical protein [Thalassotalea sp. Y01]